MHTNRQRLQWTKRLQERREHRSLGMLTDRQTRKQRGVKSRGPVQNNDVVANKEEEEESTVEVNHTSWHSLNTPHLLENATPRLPGGEHTPSSGAQPEHAGIVSGSHTLCRCMYSTEATGS